MENFAPLRGWKRTDHTPEIRQGLRDEKCGRSLAIEHNGDVYSCDHSVYPAYKLGNVRERSLAAMADSPVQQQFGEAKSSTLPRYCRECSVRFACHGECPKHRFLKTPDGEHGLNYLCAGYKRFFTHIDAAMNTMAALLQSRQAPATIMQLPRSQWMPGRRAISPNSGRAKPR